ncbi:hypothetical protein NQ176_g8706 [Zarea fungicola]|uniref:Uncharacterized protein n=1 Tax=Zarea fungicola TaxID=93591 RepID=A0ACC1MSX4_9HYPO|nr:hypothetical protein NQ176_g8706 [Lecanicillium fungicola]
MQAGHSNGPHPQPRRTQQQLHGPQNLWLRSSKPALGNMSRYGSSSTPLYQATGAAPAAATLQAGARASTFQTGHGTETSHVPMTDAMMSGTPPSEASPEDLMSTMNRLKHMIERMRQGKVQEEGQQLSDPHSASQNGAPTATGYDNQSHAMEYLRKEMEGYRKEVTAVKQELESFRSVVEQLQGDSDSLTKITTESLENLRDQLSLLVNSCPLPEEDPFAYPPLPSA